MIILYFTATGNSLAVAKKLGGTLVSMPQAMKTEQYNYEDDVIGFVFPTYCCYPPKIVRDFLVKAKLKAKYLFAVATYGNPMGRGGDGSEMLEFGKLARAAGYEFQYLNSILMVDNFVDVYEIGKEIEKLPSKKIDEHLATIIADVAERKSYVKNPGVTGKLTTAFCKKLVEKQDKGLSAQAFIVNDKCVGCGVCAKVCPYGNITVEVGKPVFHTNCLGCYACLHNCPQNAIHKANERSGKRWRNADVSLSEVIEANFQK